MKSNNKGFTLIELLAVIVVLALIMTITISNILNSSNTAQKKSFYLEGQKILNAASEYVAMQETAGQSPLQIANKCLQLSEVGIKPGGYKGSVYVSYSNGSYGFKLYLTNDKYIYKGIDSETAYAGIETLGDSLGTVSDEKEINGIDNCFGQVNNNTNTNQNDTNSNGATN